MSAQFEGLLGAGTFVLAAKTPEGCNVIDARWVCKWKADGTGKIVKAKARLVEKGFKQKTAYEIGVRLVGSEMCIRDRVGPVLVLGQRHSRVLLFFFATLRPFAGTEMVEALISEQRASDEGELPNELVQDVESESASFQEACSS